jgi:hypothetical protein
MAQQLYVEKPGKVLAEQFDPAADPPAAGVCTCNLTVPYQPTGHAPHVHAQGQVWWLHDTDWIRTNRWTLQPIDVLSDVQFTDEYGQGPPAEEGEP